METFIMLLALATLGGTLIGVLNPKWIFNGKFKSRIRILLYGLSLFIVLLFLATSFGLKRTTATEPIKEMNATEKAEYDKALRIHNENEKIQKVKDLAFAKKMEKEAIEKEKNQPKNLVSIKFEFTKGGFGTVMIADFTIINKNKSSIKDITLKCEHTADSGARLGKSEKTIFQIVPANGRKTIKKFNMGHMHSQANSSACRIVSFSFNGKRVWK